MPVTSLAQALRDNIVSFTAKKLYFQGEGSSTGYRKNLPIENDEMILSEKIPFRININTLKISPIAKISDYEFEMAEKFFIDETLIHIEDSSGQPKPVVETVCLGFTFDKKTSSLTNMQWRSTTIISYVDLRRVYLRFEPHTNTFNADFRTARNRDSHKIMKLNGDYNKFLAFAARVPQMINMF